MSREDHTIGPFSRSLSPADLVPSDIKPDNILIDQLGHIKLSDFGLSTGFHKQHDSAYYQRLLGNGDGNAATNRQSQANINVNNGARNSVMVNAINLTMTSKQDIATWKANRRKLAYSTVGTPDYVSGMIAEERVIVLCAYWSADLAGDLPATGLW